MKHHKLPPVIRHIVARPRLSAAILFSWILLFILPPHWRQSTKLLFAWDSGAGLYLVMAAIMMAQSNLEKIRLRAAIQDEGRIIVLLTTTIASVASLFAIVAELSTAKDLIGTTRYLHIALAGITVFVSWAFMQTMFALHYAHEYYLDRSEEASRGLEFPGHPRKPDYWDFIYFSFVIGTAAQTADINITSHIIRRIVTLHCIIMFFFNTTILALTINIAAGLL
ncbi:MAG: DUF1345 domain-containing protein [Pseudomonadota bacterium]